MKPYPLKRPLDFAFSLCVVLVFSPILLLMVMSVWLQDFKNPVYFARRVGLKNVDFTMFKIRSMVVDAEKTGVNSTTTTDARITPVGKIIRKLKVDELIQFLNVLIGNMSIVGPRPNTRACGVDLYSETEMKLLDIRPGITDFSSIIFSDEGTILSSFADADTAYNEIIRPWKSRFGLFYIANASFLLDVKLIYLTVLAIVNKDLALEKVSVILTQLGAAPELIDVSRRKGGIPIVPSP